MPNSMHDVGAHDEGYTTVLHDLARRPIFSRVSLDTGEAAANA